MMDPKRVGVPYANLVDEPPKKKFKPSFSKQQIQGRLWKEINGQKLEFLYNNFDNEKKINTAIVGDSIVDSLCVDACVSLSLSGGRVEQFYALLDTLESYKSVIFIIGGNNLSYFNEAGEEPEIVMGKIRKFYNAIRDLPQKPKVVACTALKRCQAKHFNIDRFNAMLTSSSIDFYRMHQHVHKAKCFKDSDGIHLTEEGFHALACGINKCIIEKKLDWLIDWSPYLQSFWFIYNLPLHMTLFEQFQFDQCQFDRLQFDFICFIHFRSLVVLYFDNIEFLVSCIFLEHFATVVAYDLKQSCSDHWKIKLFCERKFFHNLYRKNFFGGRIARCGLNKIEISADLYSGRFVCCGLWE